jgi:hypothetical protein
MIPSRRPRDHHPVLERDAKKRDLLGQPIAQAVPRKAVTDNGGDLISRFLVVPKSCGQPFWKEGGGERAPRVEGFAEQRSGTEQHGQAGTY